MSTRTVIEINHDHIANMTAEDWEAIKNMCLHYPDLDGHYRRVNGVEVLLQRHHSTDLILKTKYQEVKL